MTHAPAQRVSRGPLRKAQTPLWLICSACAAADAVVIFCSPRSPEPRLTSHAVSTTCPMPAVRLPLGQHPLGQWSYCLPVASTPLMRHGNHAVRHALQTLRDLVTIFPAGLPPASRTTGSQPHPATPSPCRCLTHQNEAELAILVLAVALKVLADGHCDTRVVYNVSTAALQRNRLIISRLLSPSMPLLQHYVAIRRHPAPLLAFHLCFDK